jgi:hypothetical protein
MLLHPQEDEGQARIPVKYPDSYTKCWAVQRKRRGGRGRGGRKWEVGRGSPEW